MPTKKVQQVIENFLTAPDDRAARLAIGVEPGKDVQPFSKVLESLSRILTMEGSFLVGNGEGWSSLPVDAARSAMGLGKLATEDHVDDSMWHGGPLGISNGGTGAKDKDTARKTLGLMIGRDVQGYSEKLDSLSKASTADRSLIISSGGVWVSMQGRQGLAAVGVGHVGFLDHISDANWDGKSLSVAHGGTGASGSREARANLGLEIGKDVQGYSSDLQAIASLNPPKDGVSVLVTNGQGWDAITGDRARAALGFGELSTCNKVDNSKWSGEPLSVQNGGTGAKAKEEARVNLGVEIGKDVQAHNKQLDNIANARAEKGNGIIGTGNGWMECSPVMFRSAMGLIVGRDVQPYNETLEGLASIGERDGFLVRIEGRWHSADAAFAREFLGLVPGRNVQPYSEVLSLLASIRPMERRTFDGADGEVVEVENPKDVSTVKSAPSILVFGQDGWVLADKEEAKRMLGLVESGPEGGAVGADQKQALKNKRISCSDNHVIDLPAEVTIPVGDETTATRTAEGVYRMPFGMKLKTARAYVCDENSSPIEVTIQKAGQRVMTGDVMIPAGKLTSRASSEQPMVADSKLADDVEIRIQARSTGSIYGLKVVLIGTRM